MTSATDFVIQGEGVDYILRILPNEYSGVLLDSGGNRIGEFKRKPFSLRKFTILVGDKDYILKMALISTSLVSKTVDASYRSIFSSSFKNVKTKCRATNREFIGQYMGCFDQHRLFVQDSSHTVALILANCLQLYIASLG